jgi:hypothetical protein
VEYFLSDYSNNILNVFGDAGVTYLVKCREYPLSAQKETTEHGFDRKKSVTDIHRHHSRGGKKNSEKDQLNTQLLSFSPIDREKVYSKMCMNRIMLIIEYMNAIYALKKQDNHIYPATSSFCIRILSSDICILYDIRLPVPWSGHSKVLCIVLWFTAQRSYYAGADSGFYVGEHPCSFNIFF